MKEQISKIIEENLPKQMGEVLQKRFRELEEKEKQLVIVTDDLKTKILTIAELNKRVTALTKSVEFIEDVRKLKINLDREKHDLDVTILNEKLKAAEVIKNNTFQFASIVFKSVKPAYDLSLFGNIPKTDQYGNSLQSSFNVDGTVNVTEK